MRKAPTRLDYRENAAASTSGSSKKQIDVYNRDKIEIPNLSHHNNHRPAYEEHRQKLEQFQRAIDMIVAHENLTNMLPGTQPNAFRKKINRMATEYQSNLERAVDNKLPRDQRARAKDTLDRLNENMQKFSKAVTCPEYIQILSDIKWSFEPRRYNEISKSLQDIIKRYNSHINRALDYTFGGENAIAMTPSDRSRYNLRDNSLDIIVKDFYSIQKYLKDYNDFLTQEGMKWNECYQIHFYNFQDRKVQFPYDQFEAACKNLLEPAPKDHEDTTWIVGEKSRERYKYLENIEQLGLELQKHAEYAKNRDCPVYKTLRNLKQQADQILKRAEAHIVPDQTSLQTADQLIRLDKLYAQYRACELSIINTARTWLNQTCDPHTSWENAMGNAHIQFGRFKELRLQPPDVNIRSQYEGRQNPMGHSHTRLYSDSPIPNLEISSEPSIPPLPRYRTREIPTERESNDRAGMRIPNSLGTRDQSSTQQHYNEANRDLTFSQPSEQQRQQQQELRNMVRHYSSRYQIEVTVAQTIWDQEANTLLPLGIQIIPETEISKIATSPTLDIQQVDSVKQSIANVIRTRYSQDGAAFLVLQQLHDFVHSLYAGLNDPNERGNNTEGTAALNTLRWIRLDQQKTGRNPALQNLLRRDNQLRTDFTNWFNRLNRAGINLNYV